MNTTKETDERRDTDLMVNIVTEQAYDDYSDRLKEEMRSQIEHALANVRAAIRITKDEKVLAQLMSAEHHLTREV